MPHRFENIKRIFRNRIQWGLHTGALREGDRLPPARELASEFGSDVRTVLRAARELAAEDVIELRNRSGMYVAAATQAPIALSPLQATIVEVLGDALERGVRPCELRRLLDDMYYGRNIRVACVETNADHAEAIASMAARGYGVNAEPVSLDALAKDGPDNPLGAARIVLTTSFLVGDVRRAAEPFGRPVFVAAMERPQGLEVMRCVEDRPTYVIGIDRRWAERGAAALEGTSAGANLRLLVFGEDDLNVIPEHADIFATPAAARHLEGSAIASRIRVFRYALRSGEARRFIAAIVAESCPKTDESAVARAR